MRHGKRVRISRGWAALLVLALLLGAGAYWVGPLRPPPVELELLALDGEQALPEVTLRGAIDPEEGVLRYPLRLALHNSGARAARPQQIALHVPARFRVATPQGRLTGEVARGVPLRRYVLGITAPALQPGAPPQPLPGLETIWLEPDLPRYYCIEQAQNVPEFVPAPRYDAGTLSDIRIFYSVRAGDQRSTGLLRVRVDPRQLTVTPAPMPPTFPTSFEDEVEQPDLGALRYGGTRNAWCGDPEQPMELQVVQWLTAGNGSFYVIYVQGQPRKHLYDLNGDGIIELETWDVNGDGRFDARRQARFPVPEFLVPLPERRFEMLVDTVPPDPAWLELFGNTAAGPLRFTRRPARVAATPADTLAEPALAAGVDPLPPPDSAWLALFLDSGAGPFRFSRGTRPATRDVAADTVSPPDVQPDTVPADPPPPPPRRRVPLGVPVPPNGGAQP